MTKPKILVIVGPTSSGKTSLSIKLAKEFNGEVISADSRQVYRGLDLASGKVTKEEMGDVPHHLLDVEDIQNTYTVVDFEKDATKAVKEILKRGKLPIIAGGTFFYVDALLGRTSTPKVPENKALRSKLEEKSVAELFAELEQKDPRRASTIDPFNKRRLVRALEIIEAIGYVPPTKTNEKYNAFIIGIETEKEKLHHNTKARLEERVKEGMIEEIAKLHETGASWQRLENLGLECRYVSLYLQGKMELEEMLEKLETEIRHFAKRQMTWLKRDKEIHWFKKDDERIVEEVKGFLRGK